MKSWETNRLMRGENLSGDSDGARDLLRKCTRATKEEKSGPIDLRGKGKKPRGRSGTRGREETLGGGGPRARTSGNDEY